MPDEIRSELGFDATQAIATLGRLAQEIEEYNKNILAMAQTTGGANRAGVAFSATAAKMAGSVGRLTAASRELSTTVNTLAGAGFSQISVDMNGIVDAQTNIIKSGQQAGSVIAQANQKMGETATRAGAAADSLGQSLKKAGDDGASGGKAVLLSWQSVVRIFAIQTIHRAITLITNAFADGLQKAVEYETALAEIQTIGGQLNMSMGQLRSTVRGISEQFAQPLDVVAEGLYQTLSNQVADGAANFQFLAAANKFATAAVTDTASAVNLLSSTLNSYNISTVDAEEVAGKLFKTIELGRIRGEEFANTFGRVTVLSSQLGISLDEVLASIATLTVSGLKYNEAFTLINNTTLKLIRPTENLKKVYGDLGVASAEAGIQAYGFQGFLEKLTEAAGDTASEIGELFNRVRAVRGVLGLTGNATERYAENLREIEKAAGIDLQKAFDTIFQTDAKKFEQQLIRIQNVFTDTFGIGTVKTLNFFFGAFGGGVETLEAFRNTVVVAGTAYLLFSKGVTVNNLKMIGSFASYRAAATAALTTTRAFLATPLGAALAIGAAVFAATAAWNKYATAAKRAAEDQQRANQFATQQFIENEQLRRKAVEESEKEILAKAQQFLQKREALYQKDAAIAQNLQDSVFGSIADQVADRLGVYEQFVERVREHSEGARDAIREIQKDLLSAQDKLRDFELDVSLEGLNDQQKVFKLISESQERVRDSNAALLAGDKERAETLAQQAESLAKQARSTAKQSGNQASITKSTNQVFSTLAQQKQIQQFTLDQQNNAIKAADKIRAQEEARSVRLKEIEKRLGDLTKILKDKKLIPEFDRKKVQEEIDRLAKLYQDELAKAGKNARILEQYDPDTKKLADKLQQAFRDPLTGAKIDVVDLFNINFSNILSVLRRQADNLPEAEKIALEKFTGKKIEEGGLGETQTEISKKDDDLRAASKATEDYANAQLNLSNQATLVNQKLREAFGTAQQLSLRAFGTEATGILGWIDDALGNANVATDKFFNAIQGVDISTFDRMSNLLGDIPYKLVQLGLAADKALNPETFNAKAALDTAKALSDLAEQAKSAGYPQLATQIREIAIQVQNTLKAARESADLKVISETLKPQEEKVKELGESFNKVGEEAQGAGTSAISGSKTAIGGLNSELSKVNQLVDAYKRKAAAAAIAAASGGGAEQVAYFGALVHRQLGGLVPDLKTVYRQAGGQVGLDSVMVRAQPGESVNTVDATRKFFPQIQAMNAGLTPSFNRSEGITTNNFGDVNIEVVEATNARDTARTIMKTIKRETRRGTFNLRRSR